MFSVICAAFAFSNPILPPEPFGAIPSPRQLAWHEMEYYGFVHFGPNTFTAKEWGDGKEDPKIFNPTSLDTDQWCRVFSEAGMKGVIITAKHHDGFCLWPSKFSNHTVRESNWKDGKGDLLSDLSTSCKKYGLQLGVYVSPWDRNHPLYGTEEYNSIFVKTLEEVLTSYGPIFEVWFDGANGEGPNGKKQVYDFPRFHQKVRDLQPGAVMFSDAGPDVRWVGNEAGYSDPTCWATIDKARYHAGTPFYKELTKGTENAPDWVPAECDVSIRRGWFWKESENTTVKSGADLFNLYLRSVGQNSSFLLNVPPDNRGLIHDNDIAALMKFKEIRDKFFAENVSKNGRASATEVRGKNNRFSAANVLDSRRDTYWATNDGTSYASLTIDLAKKSVVGSILIQEEIALGQRVTKFDVDAWVNDQWVTVARGTTIGAKRILTIDPVTTQKMRLNILQSNACPVIGTVACFAPAR